MFFGKFFINFPKLFLESDSECPWRNKQAANRLQKKTATSFKVVLFLHTSKQYHTSAMTGSTQTCGPQHAQGGGWVLRCIHVALHPGDRVHQSPGWDHCLWLLNVVSWALGWMPLQEEVSAGTEAKECQTLKLSCFP